MKKFLVFLILMMGQALYAGPPKIVVQPNGDIQVVTGGTTILAKTDGSVTVKSSAIDLTIPPSGPVPPSPPGPNPPGPNPPAPDNALAEGLKGMFGGLQEQDKVANAKGLALVYQFAANGAVSEFVQTPNAIVDAIVVKAKTLIKDGKLRSQSLLPIQERIDSEWQKLFPDGKAVLTADQKKQAADFYSKIAKILEDLSNGQ